MKVYDFHMYITWYVHLYKFSILNENMVLSIAFIHVYGIFRLIQIFKEEMLYNICMIVYI
jgi:hypothetical protein